MWIVVVRNVGDIWNGIDKTGINGTSIDETDNDGIDIVSTASVRIDIVGIGIDGIDSVRIGIDRTEIVVRTVAGCCIVKVFGGGLGKVNCEGGRIDDCPIKFIPSSVMYTC
ncbi:hypothetical protein L6452_06480 [Arctium lappa]|uniref:Uncharacterized protein n=1 Tax=Arctium lappa TaxID=4217 RepID=A0ACB9EKB1_ARCLA|nr:hypothetical protein L6452_06480 [Arctium lappa]